MKKSVSLVLAVLVAAIIGVALTDTAAAQIIGGKGTPVRTGIAQTKASFDDDGDGILNCQDPDYVPPRDGTGKKLGKPQGLNGGMRNNGYGPGDGTGYSGIGPRDGSGFGRGSGSGTGVCDGTGPKGKAKGK